MDTEGRRRTAKRVMVNYFETCFRLAGVRFDHDNQADAEMIIDLIFDEIADQGIRAKLAATGRAASPDSEPGSMYEDPYGAEVQ